MIITAKCPNCGYAENLPDEYVGNAIECVSCGIPFVVGEVRISRRLLFSEEPNVACPYCKEINTLPKDAANRNVQCWNCDKKFFVAVKMPQIAAPILDKEQSANKSVVSQNANWNQRECSNYGREYLRQKQDANASYPIACFALGFFFSLIGILVAYIIDRKNVGKALWGFAVSILFWIFIVGGATCASRIEGRRAANAAEALWEM